jgi:alkyl hydroperoxide reductase subunit AhpF
MPHGSGMLSNRMGMMNRLLPSVGSALLLLSACNKPQSGPVSMLKESDKQYVRTTLGGMKDDVRVVLFSRDGGECKYCDETEGLLADIAAAAPRVKVEVLSLKKDAARARELGIDKVPGIALLGKKDYNLRYFGLPSGYDFTPFVETIRAVADDNPGISAESAAKLAKLTKPVQITVFVTQT